MSFETRGDHCPSCKHDLDRASNASNTERCRPEPGDVSVCFYCLEVLIFAEGLGVRLPTPEELAEIQSSPSWATIEKIRSARRSQLAEMN